MTANGPHSAIFPQPEIVCLGEIKGLFLIFQFRLLCLGSSLSLSDLKRLLCLCGNESFEPVQLPL